MNHEEFDYIKSNVRQSHRPYLLLIVEKSRSDAE
jgi:hypothetical protein